jgi:NAD(P)-dependent dehydrogenase (short-subunit alcohol dehydrogenase family)
VKYHYRHLFDLHGKSAIVTGGLGILGRRFCRALAEYGADVAVIDLDHDACAGFAAELAADTGVRALGVGCDVSDRQSVAAMVDRVAGVLGAVHVLHNNAASKSADLDAFFAPFEDYSLEEWRKISAVNVEGMFLVAQAVGRQMIKQRNGGSIIQTASIYGIRGSDARIYEGSSYLGRQISNPAVYSTTKAAVVGLTRHLAAYWAPQGIRVNTLVPGGVESGQNETFKQRYSARVPLGRMAQADEMVGAVIYLASDASTYVTGQSIIVDGGLSAW